MLVLCRNKKSNVLHVHQKAASEGVSVFVARVIRSNVFSKFNSADRFKPLNNLSVPSVEGEKKHHQNELTVD